MRNANSISPLPNRTYVLYYCYRLIKIPGRTDTNLYETPPRHSAYAYIFELIDGREVQKPLPKKLHAFIQAFLIQWFGRELPKHYRVASELNILCGPDRLVPDVTVMEKAARYVEGDLADPPLLAIEIASPGQVLSDLMDKCERLLNSGTPVCWIIWPERQKAWIYALSPSREFLFEEAAEELKLSLPAINQQLPNSLILSLAELWAAMS